MIDRSGGRDPRRRRLRGRTGLGSLALAAMISVVAAPLSGQSDAAPLERDEVVGLVRGVVAAQLPEARALSILRERCLAFEMTAFFVADLTEEGASDALIEALNAACVDRPGVTSVSLRPERSVMGIGAELDLEASVVDENGVPLSDRALTWGTSDPEIATIDSRGTVVARSPGLVQISAEVEGRAAQAQVRVLPPTYSTSGVLMTGLFLPGGGQFRVKRPLRGAVTLLATAGAVAWGYGMEETTQFCSSPVGPDGVCPPGDVLREETGRPNLVPGVAVGVAIMLISAIDAAMHGKSLNEEAARVRANPFGSGDGAAVELAPDGRVTAYWRIRVR